MYAVVRFHDISTSGKLLDYGAALERLKPGTFSGPDRIPHRFSCSLSEEEQWHGHRKAIMSFLSCCGEVIKRAVDDKFHIEFDIQVNDIDVNRRLITEFRVDLELLDALHEHRSELVFSYYGSPLSQPANVTTPKTDL